MPIRNLLAGEAWHGAPPATDQDLERLRARIGGELPREYAAFLQWSNGGESRLDESYLVLWSTDEVDELNELYEVPTALPGALGIGTDGGPGLLAYVEPARSRKVALVPFGDLDLREATAMWSSLSDMIVDVMATEPDSPELSWADRVDVFLVRLPASGMKGLVAVRRALALDVGLSELRSRCATLPTLLQADVHHGRTKTRLEEHGIDKLDVVRLVKHGGSLETPSKSTAGAE